MTREELYQLFDVVESIKAGTVGSAALQPYSRDTIVATIDSLIRADVQRAREGCSPPEKKGWRRQLFIGSALTVQSFLWAAISHKTFSVPFLFGYLLPISLAPLLACYFCSKTAAGRFMAWAAMTAALLVVVEFNWVFF
jgi:hypothetical protein